MCVAIPYGHGAEKECQSYWHKRWSQIKHKPGYLLTLLACIQILLLVCFELLLHYQSIAHSSIRLNSVQMAVYTVLFNIFGAVFFALTMSLYQRHIPSIVIEYLHYGSFFFLSLYNSLFFYSAIFISSHLVLISMTVQLLLSLWVFSPIRQASFWADKKNTILTLLTQLVFVIWIFSQLSTMFLLLLS